MSNTPPSSLILLAPLAGWSAPLDEVPDAVFSARMLGDGVAIDPVGERLHAPCDGVIVTVAAQKHAITLRAANGAEILMHVGIDTVALGGTGFEVHVAPGQAVRAGMPLLSFDLDRLARNAKSLLTPVIVTDGERFRLTRRSQNGAVAVGEFLFELQEIGSGITVPSASDGNDLRREIVVALEHGIHARPAAMLARDIKELSATVTVAAHGRTANARSPVALMSLGVRHGEMVMVQANGTDAVAALAALEKALRTEVARPAPAVLSQISSGSQTSSSPGTIPGVIACRGLASGYAVHLSAPEVHVEELGAGVPEEAARLDRALHQVTLRLQALAASDHGTQREIVGAHLAFLEDPELLNAARDAVSHGKSAGYAWRASLRASIDALRTSGDERIAERVDDLKDLEAQVLMALTDKPLDAGALTLPENAILLARDLLPSQLAALDPARLVGICVASGGATSHVSILAAAMDVPTLVAMGPAILEIRAGSQLVLDADAGLLRVTVDPARWADAETGMAARKARQIRDRTAAQGECRTADGERISIFANIGSVGDARSAVALGAEGCGLLRTEFLFLDRRTAPTAEEQQSCYQEIASAFDGRPLVIRTLDIGGDKPVPYLELPAEENPALGLRGIRVSLRSQDLLREQLSAILRVRGPAQCRILLPMINEVSEIELVRGIVTELCAMLGIEYPVPVGAMIETPAAAIRAQHIAAAADFLSIGTNDLTQYTLAIDRGHPVLAGRFDPRHPAVLTLIAATVEAAHAQSKPVAVCGGLASDPSAVPILMGLGIRELSVVPAAIPQLKALIGTLTMEQCAALAAGMLER